MSLLLILSIASPLIPLTIGFQRQRLTLLWLYPLTGLIFDLLVTFLKRGLHVSYQWPANIFIIAEFLLLSFIYKEKIFRNDKLFYLFVISCSLGFIVQTSIHSIWAINMTGGCFFTFIYILYGIAGLYSILKKREIIYLEKSWFFWLNVALIVYASGVFLLFLFRDYMIRENQQLYLLLWNNIFLVLNITKNFLLAVSLYRFRKVVKNEPG